MNKGNMQSFDELQLVMKKLLTPGSGCPWDLEQTHLSLKRYLLEEAYEVIEAIEEGDPQKLVEELGDVLLQVVFHAELAEKEGLFTLEDVVKGISEKMIRRHPHVFADTEVSGSAEVLKNWEEIKAEEKPGRKKSVLSGVPQSYPALLASLKLQEKAAKVGFDWPDIKGAWEKMEEEKTELHEAWMTGEGISEEIGDLLFSVVNLARFMNVEPEEALAGTNRRFTNRFGYIEEILREKGLNFEECSLEELEKYWIEAKKRENEGFFEKNI